MVHERDTAIFDEVAVRDRGAVEVEFAARAGAAAQKSKKATISGHWYAMRKRFNMRIFIITLILNKKNAIPQGIG
jgi:hypothetical protein